MVCARHLKCFGYYPEIFYPKQPPKDIFLNLTKQCKMCDIPFLESCPTEEEMNSGYSLVVDALFGFSFNPPIRAQFVEIIRNISNTSTPVCSIDIPSGESLQTNFENMDHSIFFIYNVSLNQITCFIVIRLGC